MTTSDTETRQPLCGVIFDLDGTLADTLEDITDAMNAVLAEVDRKPISLSKVRSLVGQGLVDLLKGAFDTDDDAFARDVVERYRPLYAECMLVKTRLYPGVADMLDALHRADIPMAVLSNKPDYLTKPICASLLARWPFVECRGHLEPHARKPDAAVAIELASTIGRRVEDIGFVGDSDVDVLTAHNAGMRSVGVTWGFRDRDVILSAGPDHLVDHPSQIVPIVLGQAQSA